MFLFSGLLFSFSRLSKRGAVLWRTVVLPLLSSHVMCHCLMFFFLGRDVTELNYVALVVMSIKSIHFPA